MFKKIAFYVFIVASISLGTWAYFHLKESKAPNTSVLEHIPTDAMCVIETKKSSELISQLTRQNLIWNSLLTNESMLVAQNGINYLDSLVNSHTEIAEILSGNSLYWTFIKQEKTTEHLILFKVKEKNNETYFSDFFKSLFAKEASISSFDVYYFTNNKQKWLLCCNDGIVYLSSDLALLQNSIDLKKQESIATNTAYTELLKTNGENTTQVYINHSLTNVISRKLFTKQSLFAMDVELNEVTFTGFSTTDSSSLFNVFKNQNSDVINGFDYLPENPVFLQGFTLSDANLFYKNIQQQLSNQYNDDNEIAWNDLNDSALYNIKNESFQNLDKDMVLATYYLDNNLSQMLSLHIKDAEKSEQLLSLMSDSLSVLSEIKIYTLNRKFAHLFKFQQTEFENKYACLYQQHLLLFSDKVAVNCFLQAQLNSQLLSKNELFMNYANDNLLLECNYFYYENSELIKLNNLNSILNSEELWKSENPTSHISITAKNFKNQVQVRVNANHAQPQLDDNSINNVLWTFAADSLITTPVNVFTNHLTQENELCFQDNANQVYLVSSTSNLIWKKKINESVRSAFYTVDIFKNGKFQLLFNTDNYLHLIDRNGNYVQGFPVKLPAKVTSHLSVLDYENNKDYRLFLACADKRIYNFSLYGIKTEGFTPVKTDDIVTLPINYARVGASDYLITADVSGKIYAFSRKGEGRIDFKNKTIEHLDHLYISPGNNLNNTKLNYVDDKNNLLNKITLSDTKEAVKIGDELNDFSTSFALVNDDNQLDVLMYGNGALYCYDMFTSKLMEYFNELSVYTDAQLVQTSDYNWILAFDKTGEKIDVINMDGKLHGMIVGLTQKPLVCNLYKNEKTYLLLVNGNKVSCQELK